MGGSGVSGATWPHDQPAQKKRDWNAEGGGQEWSDQRALWQVYNRKLQDYGANGVAREVNEGEPQSSAGAVSDAEHKSR